MPLSIMSLSTHFPKAETLETGDLLFVGMYKFPTLLSKPSHARANLGAYTTLKRLFKLCLGVFAIRKIVSIITQAFNPNRKLGDELVFNNYYSGHVAMVLVENGVRYVIEAGAMDFASYRVAIRPYYLDETQPQNKDAEHRAWANYRGLRNNLIWVQRPKNALDEAENTQLANYAKSLLGRPYGLIDSLEFADDSRIYCSDFVYKCYAAIGIPLDDNRSWRWFYSSTTIDKLNFQLPKQTAMLNLIDKISNVLNLKMPALALPALYYSKNLVSAFTPDAAMAPLPYGVEQI